MSAKVERALRLRSEDPEDDAVLAANALTMILYADLAMLDGDAAVTAICSITSKILTLGINEAIIQGIEEYHREFPE